METGLAGTIVPVLVVSASAALAFLATLALIRHAAALRLVQSPNARSSHVRPTPTGGGLGILAGTLLTGLYAASTGGGPYWIILAASIAFAALGLADDRYEVPATARLVVQAAIVGVLCATLWTPPASLSIPLVPGFLLTLLCLVAGVWWVNLFNFMDGIDGFAASEAIFVAAAAALLLFLGASGSEPSPLWWWMLGTVAATGGFLLLNFPPARIFMGDVGSNHLAALAFGFALVTISDGSLEVWTWGILIASFSVDATVTLLRRALRRQHLFAGHREHGYQRLSRRWGGHRPVTLSLTAVNVLWLLPLASAAEFFPGMGLALCITAHVPLVVTAWLVGSGLAEAPRAG
jgi:Fuc2NAc and GlcNAc transferase